MLFERRAIKQQEIDVIRATIAQVSVHLVDSEAMASLPGLIVVKRCECGCASVDFEERAPDLSSHPVAKGIGKIPRGGRVGVIVWGLSDAVTGLEIYDLGAGDCNLVLPVPDSIEPFEGSDQWVDIKSSRPQRLTLPTNDCRLLLRIRTAEPGTRANLIRGRNMVILRV
jgi:hypothetical protein